MDNETESIYLRARYYNPSIGRFTTEDQIKDGSNWYVYCGGNPIMFWDKMGLMPEGDVLFNILNNYSFAYNINSDTTFNNQQMGINRRGLEMWFSVLVGEETISGTVYAMSNNKYHYKESE